jgi:SAM-dependent methyltransferase
MSQTSESKYWSQRALMIPRGVFHPRIARYKRMVHLRLLERWAPSLPGKAVLKTDLFEEAFGADALLDELDRRSGFAVGIEISPWTAARAKTRFATACLLSASAASLPFRPASFDLVFSNSTLDHLPPPDVERALSEFARILKPEGLLILTLDNKHNPLHVFSHWVRRLFGWFYTDRCYTVEEARAAVGRSGFRVTAATAIYHVPFPVNFAAKKASRFLGPRLDPGLDRLLRLFDRGEGWPTRFLTGRHIALRAVLAAEPK